MIITLKDVRKAKMCAKGARDFFKANSLDWNDFIKNGIDSKILIETNDAMALRVIKNVEKEQGL